MVTPDAPEFARNMGFWDEDEQQAIIDANVAIAGVGGDGYHLGLRLAQMGVRTFDVADPEVFEPENANRVPGATTETYGRKKVDVFREQVLRINPDADVRVYEEGVTPENVARILGRATLALDESELTHLEIGTAWAREARRLGIPNMMVMNVGFAAQVTSFDPLDKKHTFERMMGFSNDEPLEKVAERKLDLSRCVPYLPPYGDIESLKAVEEGASLPSIAQGVDVAASMGASQAFLHIVRGVSKHRPEPIWAPRMAYMDAYNFKSGVTSHPRLSHYRTLSKMVMRNVLHLNPRASYTEADRSRRNGELLIEDAAKVLQEGSPA